MKLRRRPSPRAWGSVVGLMLLALAREASGAPPLFGPTRPAEPPLAPGTAADPREDAESAAPTAPEKHPPAAQSTGPPLDASEERPRPSYGGPDEGTTAGHVALWVPRILLAPLYLISEYLLRRPLGAMIMFGEKHYVPQRFLYYTSFGTYGTEHPVALRPVANFEWGVRANAGLLLSWDNAIVKDNGLRASATVGGPRWLRFDFADTLALDPRNRATLLARFERRADLRFWGLGPSSPEDGYRFTVNRAKAGLSHHTQLWRSSEFQSEAGVRSAKFDASAPSGPSVADGLATGALASAPPGFGGYVLAYQQLAGALDTRRPRHAPSLDTVDFIPPPGTGVRVEVRGEHAVELDAARSPRSQWIRYGGGIGLYQDLTGQQRTIGVSISTELIEPFRDGEIPFLELPSLGGPEPMRAFRSFRLLGQSQAAAKLSYSWPVWTDFDGVIEAALGNAFGRHYDGFALPLLRGSFAAGLETTRSRDIAFQVLFGAGTRPIDEGFAIEAFRFVVGTSSDF
jgi:hypothetical protein